MVDKSVYRKCPICQSSTSEYVGDKNNFQIVTCSVCRSLYSSVLPQNEEIENYDSHYIDSNLQIPEFIYERLEELFTSFSDYKQTNNWLDVGFGSGIILEVAKELGWNVFGTEVSDSAIERSKRLNFNVFRGELHEANFPDDHFDIITASEVAEHVADPRKLFEEIARILRPGGLMWATTPSARGISYLLLGLDWTIVAPPEHIQLFSKKGIATMLYECGFSYVNIQTHGVNPGEIFNYFYPKKEFPQQFSRVNSNCQINENLEKSFFTKKLKNLANQILDVMGIGDSLKIYAQK